MQTFLKPGSIHPAGYVGEAVDYVMREQILKNDWTFHVDQFRYHTDSQAWRGEFWGKMMKGACLGYTYSQDEELYRALESTVRDLLSTQDEQGRITTYSLQEEFKGWDMWGRKYVMVGLETFYDICKDEALKREIIATLRRHADNIMSKVGPASEGKTPINLSAGDWQGMPASSILEPMVQLYVMTGEGKYLGFSSYIVDEGGAAAANVFQMAYENILSPYQYIKDWAKAYEMTACFVGLADYAMVTGSEKWKTAVVNYYKKVAEQEITIAGSGGGDGPSYNVRGMAGEQWNNMAREQTNPNIRHMQETCVTAYWIVLGEKVLQMTDDSTVMDQIERSLYNALLGALRGKDVPAVEWTASEFLWDYFSLLSGTRNNNGGGAQPGLNSCCPANGHTALLLCAWLQVTGGGDGPTVNLYHPGSFTAETPSGKAVTLQIDTAYPAQGDVAVKVSPAGEETFSIRLRIPSWSASTQVLVNGQAAGNVTPGQYLTIRRAWRAGDKVEIRLDMATHIVQSPQGEASGAGEFQALIRGPILLARDARFQEGSVFAGRVFKQDADGNALVTPSNTGLFENHMEFEVQTQTGHIHVTDYASAGSTWDSRSEYAAWLPAEKKEGPAP